MPDDNPPGLGPVAELRQYTLHPGRFDDLIEVFEEHLIAGQEVVGMTIGGLFHDEADPDRFVWMRGFPDLMARTRALEEFYGGPVWAEHRDTANATMVDSDDVLLLQPGERSPGRLPSGPEVRAALGARLDLAAADAGGLAEVLADVFGTTVVTWVSHPGPNGFPALPVRPEQNALIWLAAFEDEAAREAALSALDTPHDQLLRLRPTARSRHDLS